MSAFENARAEVAGLPLAVCTSLLVGLAYARGVYLEENPSVMVREDYPAPLQGFLDNIVAGAERYIDTLGLS